MSVKCGVHIFSGSFGLSGSAVDQRTKYKLFFCEVWGSYIYRLVCAITRNLPSNLSQRLGLSLSPAKLFVMSHCVPLPGRFVAAVLCSG